jgi:hypothetical protein
MENIELSISEFIFLMTFAIIGVVHLLLKLSRWYNENLVR